MWKESEMSNATYNKIKNRTAASKTFLALAHHAKPLNELASAIAFMALAGNFTAQSVLGGSNSWNLTHPDGRVYRFRARPKPWRIEVRHCGILIAELQTRVDVIRWFENV
jgi:hypothetical protein